MIYGADIPVTEEEDEAWAERSTESYFPFPIRVDPSLPPNTIKVITPTDEVVVELDEEERRDGSA